MTRRRPVRSMVIVVASVLAFAAALSADQAARRLSQAVVTSEDPIWAAQDPAPAPAEPQGEATPPAGRGGRGQASPPQPRPYDQVITSTARTDDGVFKVHRVGDLIYYEIPKAELGREFLWVTQIKRNTIGAGFGGQAAGNRVVRWDLTNNRVLLRLIDYSIVADPSSPISRAVATRTIRRSRVRSMWRPSRRRVIR